MGGRGASSESTKILRDYYGTANKYTIQNGYILNNMIEGRKYKIVQSTEGYQYWNIGKNAPTGYIPLYKQENGKSVMAMYKSKYADSIGTKQSYIEKSLGDNTKYLARLETQVRNYEKGNSKLSVNAYEKAKNNIKKLKNAIEVQKKLPNIFK